MTGSATTKKLLFAQYTAQPSGSPISGLIIVRRLVQEGWKVLAAFGVDGGISDSYRRAGCDVVIAPHGQWLAGGTGMRAVKRWWREFNYRRGFVQLIRQFQPSVVYANTLMGLAPALAARRCGVPCVWHVRELFDDVGGEMRPPWPGGKRLVASQLTWLSNRIVCISRAVRDNVIPNQACDKTLIIPNAVDNSFFNPALDRSACCSELDLDPQRPVIGVPATLRPVKGLPFFLESAAAVLQQFPGVQVAITGDGSSEYKRELQTCVKRWGLNTHVRFLGTVADMFTFYCACDVICVPSRSESFGRGAAESFACGIPVVASAVGGLREIVSDGDTGLLVEYGRPQELAHAILRILTDRELAKRLAANARRKAETEYRESTYQNRIMEVIDSVVGNKEARIS